MIKTGIFGGSFNPIHNGHISLTMQLKKLAGLDEVWLMVSPQNPLKQQADLLCDAQRLEMARIATEGVEGITVSDYEMALPRPSYTWNTLQHLRNDYPDRELVLLIGGDNWAHFDRWYRHEDIAREYRIVVYPRAGADSTEATPASGLELLPYSSTEIRARIKAGEPVSGMVPPAVEEYIKQHKLYA